MASSPTTVNPIVYPAKDIWKAVWWAFSATIATGTIAVNDTKQVFGMTFTVRDVDMGVFGNIKVECTASNLPTDESTGSLVGPTQISFPNYIAPGYTASPMQTSYTPGQNQAVYQNGYLINV